MNRTHMRQPWALWFVLPVGGLEHGGILDYRCPESDCMSPFLSKNHSSRNAHRHLATCSHRQMQMLALAEAQPYNYDLREDRFDRQRNRIAEESMS